jgi:hypothetical protein
MNTVIPSEVRIGHVHLNLKTEMAEGESAAVIGPTRLPASRVASPFRCNRCEPGSLVEPSTTPSSSLSIPVSRLKVADLERALGFWQGVIGLEVMQRVGNQAAFLSAGGYHHHIALNTWESAGGKPPPARSTGLYETGPRNACHLARRRSSLIGSVSRLPAIDLIAGCATSLPLRPLRSPDQNDNLFENPSKTR